jgi:hypothetical protein
MIEWFNLELPRSEYEGPSISRSILHRIVGIGVGQSYGAVDLQAKDIQSTSTCTWISADARDNQDCNRGSDGRPQRQSWLTERSNPELGKPDRDRITNCVRFRAGDIEEAE